MDWYYAFGGGQKGPVDEEEFQRLVQQGTITPETLVWREGMASWQPYSTASPTATANLTAGGVACSGCRQIFSHSDVVSLAGGFYCATCKPLALQRLREGEGGSSAAEATRNEHLKHEASIKSIGLLYYLGGFGLLILALATMSAPGTQRGGAGSVVPVITAAVFLILGAGQICVGAGLRRLHKWARIPTGILSGIGLLGFPVGTLINVYILYLVFSQKGKTVFSDEYQIVIEQTPHIKYRTSIIVWIFLGLVLALMGVALVAAFLGRRP